MFDQPLPRDLALIVLDYSVGPDNTDHMHHMRVVEQIKAYARDSRPLKYMLRPWFAGPSGYVRYALFGRPRFDKHAGAAIHAIWPLFSVIDHWIKYTRPYAEP